MKLPPLNTLRAFESAARLESFAAAADELHVTPSAISHQIKSLEQFLGLKLFERRTRRIEPTKQARQYLVAVQGAFDEISVATRRLMSAEQARGINLDVAPAFASGWLITRLHDFYRRHPGLPVRLSTSLNLVDFDHSDHDLAVRYGQGDWPGLDSCFLMAEELVPLCSPRLLEQVGPLAGPEDLLTQPLLISLAKMGDWERWFDAAEVDYGERVVGNRFEDTPLALEAAVAGAGIAIANRLLVSNELSDGRLVIPVQRTAHSGKGFYLVYPRSRRAESKLVLFREWILEQAASSRSRS